MPPNSQAGAQAPVDDTIRDLDRLYRSISDLQGSASDPARQSAQAAAALSQIERRAAGLPPPIDQWILGVSRAGADLSANDARQQLGELWRGGPGQTCQRLAEDATLRPRRDIRDPAGRFRPAVRPGRADRRLLHRQPEGAGRDRPQPLDPARRRPGRAAPVPPSPGAVRARRRHPRQPVPGRWQPALLGFSLALVQADPAVQAVMVELDGRRLEFRPGDAEARRIRWPGAEGTGAAAVTFVGPEGPVTAASERGGWALFRLLDDATLRPRGRDALELQIAAGGRQAVFILTADGATNPFARSLLASFRCPQSL
ncbi:type VI secretion IcmF C-terminal domain-containing protein [Pseudoroseomonas wenyumeiae]